MAKKKQYKSYNKKKRSTLHPHVELLQSEIAALEEKLQSFEELETELTQEQEMDKRVTEACLERYRDTLNKSTEASFTSKLAAYHNILIEDARKKQEYQVLTTMQLFYLMRLGQLGLFQFMDENAVVPLTSIADLCDQMIGAAVHFANTPTTSPKIRDENRLKVFQLIKKLDQSTDEVINDDLSDKTTFKQVREFLAHLWENTVKVDPEDVPNVQKDQPILQFDTMMPTPSSSHAEDENVTPKTSLSISTHNTTTHDTEVADKPDENISKEEAAPSESGNRGAPEETKSKEETAPSGGDWGKSDETKEEVKSTGGWGSSEDLSKKSAWGHVEHANQIDNVQSKEKSPHSNKNLQESESTTSTSTTKSSKKGKDSEKRKKKKDSERKAKDNKSVEPEVQPKEEAVSQESATASEAQPKKDIVSQESKPGKSEKESTSAQGDAWGKSKKKDEALSKKDNWKQADDTNEWTSFDTTTIKEGGWDSPDNKPSEAPATKNWEELKNNFGDITISEDSPATGSHEVTTDDGWRHSHHSRGRGRGQRGGRGRGGNYQFRGGYRGNGMNKPRGHGRDTEGGESRRNEQ